MLEQFVGDGWFEEWKEKGDDQRCRGLRVRPSSIASRPPTDKSPSTTAARAHKFVQLL